MKFNIRLTALLLTLIMVIGLFASCETGSTEETTVAPETTKAPETQAPAQTEAPKAEGGCGGMIAGGVAIIAILGTALLIKKED